MERLTEKRDGRNVIPLRQDGANKWALCSAGMGEAPARYLYGDHADRLAAYEETGLEPEEISARRDLPAAVDAALEAKANHIRDLLQAEREGRLMVPPVKPGDTVHVDARTLPYNYLHPADGCRDFARCEVVSIVTTGAGTYLKLRALYPSRAGRRDYLRYIVGAIGKTVFLTREEAEAALERKMEGST